MSSFINKMITRHLAPEHNVYPRLRGRFEGVEQSSIEAAENDGFEITDALTEKPVLSPKADSTGMTDNLEVNKRHLSNQPNITINDHSEAEYTEDNDLKLKNTIQKPLFEESSEAKVSKNSTVKPEQSPSLPPEESSEKPVQTLSGEPQLISFVATTEPISNDQNVKNLQHVEPYPIKQQDFPITESSISNDFAPDPEMENTSFQPSELNQEKTVIEHTNKFQDNSLIALHPYRDIPDYRQSFDPIFNVPEQPIIKVSIGRINIRAEVQKTAPVIRPKKTSAKPKLSLQEYLKKQNDQTR